MLFAATLEQPENAEDQFFILVPEEVAAYFLSRSGPSVKCTLEGNLFFHGKIKTSRMGQHIIEITAFTTRHLGLRQGQLLYIELSPNEGILSLKMSDELIKALFKNEKASKAFYKLSPGIQYNIVYFVDNIQTGFSRESKARAVTQHLAKSPGQIDFQLLLDEAISSNQSDGQALERH
jgi:hypothetical protein